MSEVINRIPEFTEDGSAHVPDDPELNQEEVKENETDTQSQLPGDDKAADDVENHQSDDDTAPKNPDPKPPVDLSDPGVKAALQDIVVRATEGLRNEIVDLRSKLRTAPSEAQDDIRQDIVTKQGEIQELEGIAPEDVDLIEKVLRAKGYVPKQELDNMLYKRVEQEALDQFLSKYPEYKPENDPNNTNWNTLMSEFTLYAKPKDPRQIANLLERARKSVAPSGSDRTTPAVKKAVQTASHGSGGVQKSSSRKTLEPRLRSELERGGWSEEEIARIESKL